MSRKKKRQKNAQKVKDSRLLRETRLKEKWQRIRSMTSGLISDTDHSDQHFSKQSLIPKYKFRGQEDRKPSLETGGTNVGAFKQSPIYTGTSMIGIGTLHKSNAVPIFSEESAVDIAKMRRG